MGLSSFYFYRHTSKICICYLYQFHNHFYLLYWFPLCPKSLLHHSHIHHMILTAGFTTSVCEYHRTVLLGLYISVGIKDQCGTISDFCVFTEKSQVKVE